MITFLILIVVPTLIILNRLETSRSRRKVSVDGFKMINDTHGHLVGDRVGELAFGTNLGLREMIGVLLQDEKVPGVHLAFGDPYGSQTHADWKSKTHVDVLTRGCDVWINLPRPPLEASGTSGMKAALNGGINCSILDGWWDEWFDGDNGWAISSAEDVDDIERRDELEASALFDVVGEGAPVGLALVSRLAPAIVSGNTAVVLASESAPLPAVSLGEVLATSDVPGGVVNVLTGLRDELFASLDEVIR
jgi:hypothetical protein